MLIYTVSEFTGDIEEMLSSARSAGVTDIYMPNIDSTSIEGMLNIGAAHPFAIL